MALQLAFFSSAWAQETDRPQTPILVVDWERLFSDPRVEQRVLGGIAEQRAELVAENIRIEQQLTAEELELAERRPELETTEFQELADAFDRKVQQIRADRDAKELELQQLAGLEWRKFRQDVERSLIIQIMQERGAVLVMDRNQAIMYSTSIDITDEAIGRMSALFDAASGQDSQTSSVTESEPAVE